MAKTICSEWAAELLGGSVAIRAGSFQQEFDKWFEQTGLNLELLPLAEEAFALGGAAIVLCPDCNGTAAAAIAGAESIYPLSWAGAEITACAFTFPMTSEGKSCTLAQLHLPGDSGYIIESYLFDSGTGEELPKEKLGFDQVIATNSHKPLFSFFLPGASASFTTGYPLGASVFAGAVSSLQAIQEIQSSLAAEFSLGRKRLFVPPAMVKLDENDQPVFELENNVYCSVPGEDPAQPADLSTALRAQEHHTALLAAIEFLRTECGLPAGGEPRLVRTYRKAFAKMLTETVQSAARLLGKAEPEQVEILFDILPTQKRVEANSVLMQQGLRSKLSALSDLLSCSEQAAQAELDRVAAQNTERTGA